MANSPRYEFTTVPSDVPYQIRDPMGNMGGGVSSSLDVLLALLMLLASCVLVMGVSLLAGGVGGAGDVVGMVDRRCARLRVYGGSFRIVTSLTLRKRDVVVKHNVVSDECR